jgi:hypothetical protein
MFIGYFANKDLILLIRHSRSEESFCYHFSCLIFITAILDLLVLMLHHRVELEWYLKLVCAIYIWEDGLIMFLIWSRRWWVRDWWLVPEFSSCLYSTMCYTFVILVICFLFFVLPHRHGLEIWLFHLIGHWPWVSHLIFWLVKFSCTTCETSQFLWVICLSTEKDLS